MNPDIRTMWLGFADLILTGCGGALAQLVPRGNVSLAWPILMLVGSGLGVHIIHLVVDHQRWIEHNKLGKANRLAQKIALLVADVLLLNVGWTAAQILPKGAPEPVGWLVAAVTCFLFCHFLRILFRDNA